MSHRFDGETDRALVGLMGTLDVMVKLGSEFTPWMRCARALERGRGLVPNKTRPTTTTNKATTHIL